MDVKTAKDLLDHGYAKQAGWLAGQIQKTILEGIKGATKTKLMDSLNAITDKHEKFIFKMEKATEVIHGN